MDSQIVEREETDCNIGVFWDLFILTFFHQSCWSLLFVTLNVTLGKHILSPRTNVPTYFSNVWLDHGAKIAKNMSAIASYPEVPLSRWKFARKGRRERENCQDISQDIASPLFFHLPMVPRASSPVTSRFCAKKEAPKEEAVSATWFRETAHLPHPCNPFFYSLL